jgi:hypothetical protein
MEVSKELLNNLLKKIGQVISNAVEEDKSPREEFRDMYFSEKEDKPVSSPLEKLLTKKNDEKISVVYLKPKIENDAVLQEMEVIKKDREIFEKKQEELSLKEEQIEDQHKSLQRAKIEAEQNGERK